MTGSSRQDGVRGEAVATGQGHANVAESIGRRPKPSDDPTASAEYAQDRIGVQERLRRSTALNGVRMLCDVPVAMHDGVCLSTDIYLPDAEGPFPVVLVRTPYDNGWERHLSGGLELVKRGYAFVTQDCRGRFDSEGEFYAWHDEARDGYETQEWVGQQSWCNGKIGTTGLSYLGATQWQSAPLRSKYLAAMVPVHTPSDFWYEDEFVGGAFALGLNVWWALMTSSRSMQNVAVYDWAEAFDQLPLADIDLQLGRDIGYFRDWLAHPGNDEYWLSISNRNKYAAMDVPVLNVGGWYDAYGNGALINFVGMREQAASEHARDNQRVIIGPWHHDWPSVTKVGELDFGPAAAVELLELEDRWFEYWLKGIDNGVTAEPPVRLFVMGINQWRDEYEWPLARTRYENHYLRSDGRAGDAIGGELSLLAPEHDEPVDEYVYDPRNPVPTLGGNHSMAQVVSVGPCDQAVLEARPDVLVFTSEPLATPLEITGPVSAVIYARSSARDTDFTARLCDVFPDGRSINLCEGVIRARYRDNDSEAELLEPGTVYEFRIDMLATSNVFEAGHRVRLDVSSSNYPRIDRNLNTGLGYDSSEIMVAHQAILHTPEYPSHVTLPVIPSA